jgi:hypothetical protein
MGDKKEAALELIRELINLNDVIYNEHQGEDGEGRILVMGERLGELQDIVQELGVCQCEG